MTGDADRLQQVCWNLLVNAVKFTEPGGKVRVQIDVVGRRHRVRVSDTGQGIAADFLPHVFDRFRQADGSTTRRHSGLGIGLALVRQIVELHGGTVEAESRGEGLGATFTVHLPVRRSAPDAAAPPETTETQAEAREHLTVLVVDDDVDAREVAAHFLQGGGARVITAAGADEGVRLLRDERPDVVVADIGMPGIDGYAFIRAVRDLRPDEGAETPAVALTALVREEDRRRALDAGYQSHLPKPVSREALLSTVRRYTDLDIEHDAPGVAPTRGGGRRTPGAQGRSPRAAPADGRAPAATSPTAAATNSLSTSTGTRTVPATRAPASAGSPRRVVGEPTPRAAHRHSQPVGRRADAAPPERTARPGCCRHPHAPPRSPAHRRSTHT